MMGLSGRAVVLKPSQRACDFGQAFPQIGLTAVDPLVVVLMNKKILENDRTSNIS